MNKKLGLLILPAAFLTWGALVARSVMPRPEKALPGRRKIACIGDSITFGAGVMSKRKKLAWPYVLGQKLGEDWQVLNYGISGATALLESEVVFKKHHDFLDDAILAGPETYLLMLGTNDAKTVNWRAEDYYRDYNRMIDRMQIGSPQARVVLMTPATAYPDPKAKDGSTGFGIDRDTVHEQVAPMVRQIAEERELPLIDIHNYTAGHPEWFGDGVHPNAEGNRALAEYIFERLLAL